MCRYCDASSERKRVRLPVVSQIDMMRNGNEWYFLFLSNKSLGRMKILYCPICGRRLEEAKESTPMIRKVREPKDLEKLLVKPLIKNF